MKLTDFTPFESTQSSCEEYVYSKKTGHQSGRLGIMQVAGRRVALITAAIFTFEVLTSPPAPVFAQTTLGAIRRTEEAAVPAATPVRNTATITVHAATGTSLATQTQTTTTPLTDEIIRSFLPTTPQPDPTSTEFLQVITTGSTVVINGIDIVFDSTVTNGLWQSYNGASGITSMTINARSVTFRSPTRLPGTNVSITAQTLTFQGPGALITTPLAPTPPPSTTGANGLPGLNGGNVTLQIATFAADPATPAPLDLSGGPGGVPGPGAAGTNGLSLSPVTNFGPPSAGQNGTGANFPGISAVCVDYQLATQKKQNPVHVAYYGSCNSSPSYPTSGTDAIAAGRPGVGGSGGNLSTTIDLRSSAKQPGGQSAASLGTYTGGAAGTPTASAWFIVAYNVDGGPYWSLWPSTGIVTTTNGKTVVSPAATAPQGQSGTYTKVPTTTGWATAGYGTERLAYAKALFTSNYFQLANLELQSLAADLQTSTSSSNDSSDIAALLAQVSSFLNLISANLNIFSEPLNYVPLTTLQTNAQAYSDDISSAISILYLQAVVQSATTTLQSKLAAVQAASQTASNDIATQTTTINNALATLQALYAQSASDQQEISQAVAASQAVEADWQQQAAAIVQNTITAQKTSAISDVTRLIGGLVQLTSFATPLIPGLAAAAPFINAITKVETAASTDAPWSAITGLTTLASAVNTATAPCGTQTPPSNATTSIQCIAATLNLKNQPAPTTPQTIQADLTSVSAAGTAIATVASGIGTLENNTSVPPGADAAELAKIAATDPIVSQIAASSSKIQADVTNLNTQINQTTQSISSALTAITADLQQINSSSQQQSTTVQSLSPDAVNRVNQLAQIAKDRLVWYQELLLASQQYVLLSPSSVSLDLSRVLNRVSALVENGGPAVPTESDIAAQVGLFEQDLAAVTQSIISYYSRNYSSIRVPFGISLTAAQVQALNNGQSVIFNPFPAGIVPQGASGVRVAGIQVATLDIVPPAVAPTVANVQLTATFPGVGNIAQGGYLYQFFFYPSNAQNPIVYGASKDLITGALTQIVPSPSAVSLLNVILGVSQDQDPFVTVPADAGFVLSLQSNGVPLTIRDATLVVLLDYVPPQPGVADVEIASPEGLATVSFQASTDAFQRTSGVTPTVREYHSGQTFTITAPTQIGQKTLVGWDNGAGTLLTNNLQFTATANASLTVRPVYAFSNVAVTSSANPSVSGQRVTVTATVTPPTATGAVTFSDGKTVLGTGTLNGGTATFTTSTLAPASHLLAAVYAGDTNDPASTSSVLTQTVNAATAGSTTTSLTSSANPSVSGKNVTFTATVSPANATGTITFKDGTTILGTSALNGGTAILTTSTLAAALHSLTAAYGGDTNDAASTSSVLTQTVNAATASTTTSLTSSANPSVSGKNVTFTATVSPANATGTITFKDGTTILGTSALNGGTATLTTSTLAAASHSLTAAYGGDTNDAASTSSVLTQTVNAATAASTTTSVTSSANPSVSGKTVTFTATVSPANATGTITFKDGTTILGTSALSGGTATIGTSTLSAGPHSLTAAYGGDSKDASSTSSVLTQTVNAAGLAITTPSVLTAAVSGIPYSEALEATGGTGSYQWSLTSGSLPQGVNFVSIGGILSGLLEGVSSTPGTYTFTVTVTDSSNATATKQFSLTIASTILVSSICNAASYGCSSVSPGEIVTVFGSGMGPTVLAGLQLDSNSNVATNSGGTQVLFDGVAAPMIYSVAGQLSCVVPYEVALKTVTQVEVSYLGKTSVPLSVPVSAAMPGIFTISASGVGQGAILNQDGTVNGPSNPAAAGDYVFVFATGEGQTVPVGLDGTLDDFPAPNPVLPVSATIGGVNAMVQYAGGAPGLVAGVLQVNLQVPQGVASGNAVPILLMVGSQSSQANVTLAIQ